MARNNGKELKQIARMQKQIDDLDKRIAMLTGRGPLGKLIYGSGEAQLKELSQQRRDVKESLDALEKRLIRTDNN